MTSHVEKISGGFYNLKKWILKKFIKKILDFENINIHLKKVMLDYYEMIAPPWTFFIKLNTIYLLDELKFIKIEELITTEL